MTFVQPERYYAKRRRAAAKARAAQAERRVPVAPIREAVERSGIGVNELARRLGYVKPDSRRVRRVLGITPHEGGRGLQGHVEQRTARQIADALDLDPADLGF